MKIVLPGEEGATSQVVKSQVKSVVSFAEGPNTMKNYHRNVAENKEILKMISALSTAINSTKQEVMTTMEVFDVYEKLWKKDREEVRII